MSCRNLRFAEEPGEIAVRWGNATRRVFVSARDNFLEERWILVRVGVETNVARLLDKRKRERDPPGFELRDQIRDDLASLFAERRRPREQRGGMAVLPYPEQNQVVAINLFAALFREKRSEEHTSELQSH